MFPIRTIGLTLALFLGTNALAVDLPPADKAAHFGISSLGVASTLKFVEFVRPDHDIPQAARVLASMLWTGIGAWKERQDSKKSGRFDGGDMGANVAGVIYGNLLMIEF